GILQDLRSLRPQPPPGQARRDRHAPRSDEPWHRDRAERRRWKAERGARSGRGGRRGADGGALPPLGRRGRGAVKVRTGLEVLVEDEASRIRGRRIGLVAHPASVDAELRSAVDLVTQAGAELVAIFGPEHGFAGDAQDMIAVSNEAGPSGLRVHSLYGTSEAELSPRR